MEPSDGELIRRIREPRDPQSRKAALTQLLARHHDAMLRTATKTLAGRAVSGLQPEDVVQQAIANVLLGVKLHRFDAGRRFAPWLATVVRNVAIDLLREQHPHGPLNEQATPARADDEMASVARERVEDLLAGISDEDRTLLSLFYLEQRSAEEVANLLGIELRQVYRRLHRLRLRLRSEAALTPQAD